MSTAPTATRTFITGILTLALSLAGATLVIGCSGGTAMDAGSGGGTAGTQPATAMPTMEHATHAPSPEAQTADAGMAHGMTMAQLDQAWMARPAFVRDNGTQVSEAYAFALTNPDPLESMPCYCGCVAMDHRSNLDCFFQPRTKGSDPLTFEEHASYCGICIDTALLTKHRLAEGWTLAQIRHEVDTTIGSNGVEGTHTPLPPTA
ncbi:MAG: PCYCGC motif-containing (lipo)protein [Chloroflexota bacterium]